MTAGTKTYTWYGHSGNNPSAPVLPDGTYVVKAFAKNNNIIVGVAQFSIELVSDGGADDDDDDDDTLAPVVSNLHASDTSIVAGSDTTEISFSTNVEANLTVSIKKGQIGGGYTTVRTFDGFEGDLLEEDRYAVTWNGKNDNGTNVAAGTYLAVVEAENNEGSDEESLSITVIDPDSGSNGDDDDDDTGDDDDGEVDLDSDIIKNFSIDPSTTWDPSEENLQIEFDLIAESDSLTITAEKGGKTVEILEDENVDDDDYEEEWDGTDEDGDYVGGGVWNIVVTADGGDSVSLPITVDYEKPEITSAFVTKDSFDPTKDEYTTLLYKVDSASVVTVEVYKGNHREDTLVDEKSVSKNKWYAVKWTGIDEDGDEVDEGDYKFKITAQNSTDEDVETVKEVSVKVEEDDVSSGKANVTNDAMEPVIFDDEKDSSLDINYCIDEDAKVFLAIYKGTSAGGNAEIELLDYVSTEAGCHTVDWNGKDEDNKKLDDGTYTYKLISKTENGKKDNETGKFVVGNTSSATTTTSDEEDKNEGEYSCSMYFDMYGATGTEMCDAIGWVTARGIFHGYPSGAFKPYQNIKRAEVLKVVLEAFESMLIPVNGSNLGFSDLNPYGWYMTYLRTAQFYGMLEGYEDGTARPEKTITRVEALKFVLEASEVFSGQLLTGGTFAAYADVDFSKWYAKYVGAAYTYQLFNVDYYGSQAYLHPNQLVQRGEVALMLYRLNKAGFIK
jgi:flagellar hook assembly protein FlgD